MYGHILISKISLLPCFFLIFLYLLKVRIISANAFLVLLSNSSSLSSVLDPLYRINWSRPITDGWILTSLECSTSLPRLLILALLITLPFLEIIRLTNGCSIWSFSTLWLFTFERGNSRGTNQHKEFFAIVVEIWIYGFKSSHQLDVEGLDDTFEIFEGYEVSLFIVLLELGKDQT